MAPMPWRPTALAALAALLLLPLLAAGAAALGPAATWGSLGEAWERGRFGALLLNSALLALPSAALVGTLSTLAGYGLARFRFPGRGLVLAAFLAGLALPLQAAAIPLSHGLGALGLLGTRWGAILPSVAFGLPLGALLMQAVFERLPRDLVEAARAEGFSEWATFVAMLPLAAPGIAALAALQALRSWNDVLLPLLLAGEDRQPVAVGLLRLQGEDWGLVALGATLATLPGLLMLLLIRREAEDTLAVVARQA